MHIILLVLSSGLALAEEPAPKPDEGAAPTAAEAKPAEAKPAEAKPAEASGPPIVVEVSLKNGLKMRGTMAASAAANWKKGQPMSISVKGAEPITIEADQIQTVTWPTKPAYTPSRSRSGGGLMLGAAEGSVTGFAAGVSTGESQGKRLDLRLLDTQACAGLCMRLTPARYLSGGDKDAYSWSFLNAGVGISPFYDVFLMPYYQVEWLTPNGLQARHIVGLEWGYFDFAGFSLNAEWEKQDEHQAININLLFALGYIDSY